MKNGPSAVIVGTSLITPPSVGAAVEAIKETYEANAGIKDVNFVSYIF